MRLHRLIFLAAAIAAGSAQDIKVSAARMRADVAFLSSDELEGRAWNERGSAVSIRFLLAEFAKAGLKPANNGSFEQEVPVVQYRNGERRLTLRRGGQTRELGCSGSFPREVSVTAPVVFVRYGITAGSGYDDYAGLDVKGKIAAAMESQPEGLPGGPGNTRHANLRMKVVNAQRHGAAALLVIRKPDPKRSGGPGPGGPGPAMVLGMASDERLIPALTLSDEAAAELLTPGRIDWTKPASTALEDTVVEIRITVAESRIVKTANVAGLIEGRDPKLRDETVLIGAHYDHNGKRGESVLPGADDNASGTAGLLELARVFAAGKPPRRTILLVAFGAEERGLFGSYHYTMSPLRPLESTRAALNFDMIGRDEQPSAQTKGKIDIAADTSNELNFIGLKHSPELRALFERQNRRVGLRLNDKCESDGVLNVMFRSDHYPFLIHEIPAVWIFNGFTPDYHQATDTVERLNFTKMEKIVRLTELVARALADGETPRFRP